MVSPISYVILIVWHTLFYSEKTMPQVLSRPRDVA